MNPQRKKTRYPRNEAQRQPRRRRQLFGELLEPRYLLTGSPHLLADISDGATGSEPESFVVVGDETYFTVNGSEIWKTDGTTSGTVLVKDLAAGSDYVYSFYTDLHNHNGTLVAATYPRFVLWSSDGTTDGTRIVKDFGDNFGVGMSSSVEFTTVGDSLFFVEDGDTSGPALWKSDLTEDGTARVTSAILPAWGLKNVGGTLYFTAYDDDHGSELWKSDGTESGTTLVRDIYPGTSEYNGSSYANSSYPTQKEELNGLLYFVAYDEVHGDELWRSDGTESGTVLVLDTLPGPESGLASGFLANVGGTLFFAADDGIHGVELWKSDGTSAGTSMVKDIWPGDMSSYPYSYMGYDGNSVGNLDGQLIFSADDGTHGYELWKSDGTSAGTTLVKDIQPGAGDAMYLSSYCATLDGKVFFAADDGVHGVELWESDGTEAGTQLVADVFPGNDYLGDPNSSDPWYLTSSAGMLVYSADDGVHGREPWILWASTGGITITPEGGRLVAEDIPTAGFSMYLKSLPASEVTVTLTPSDPNTAVVNPLVFTFSSDNWEVPQTVSVGSSHSSGARDFSIDATVQSGDPDYQQSIEPLLFVDLFPWHKPSNPLDTNNDRYITPIDALLVINYLNAQPEDRVMKVGWYLDVTSDEYVSPIDALRIINDLNRTDGGEGEMLLSPDATQPTLVTRQMMGVEWPHDISRAGRYSHATGSVNVSGHPQPLGLSEPPIGTPSDDSPTYTGAGDDCGPPRNVEGLEFTLDAGMTELGGEYYHVEEWQELLVAGKHRN